MKILKSILLFIPLIFNLSFILPKKAAQSSYSSIFNDNFIHITNLNVEKLFYRSSDYALKFNLVQKSNKSPSFSSVMYTFCIYNKDYTSLFSRKNTIINDSNANREITFNLKLYDMMKKEPILGLSLAIEARDNYNKGLNYELRSTILNFGCPNHNLNLAIDNQYPYKYEFDSKKKINKTYYDDFKLIWGNATKLYNNYFYFNTEDFVFTSKLLNQIFLYIGSTRLYLIDNINYFKYAARFDEVENAYYIPCLFNRSNKSVAGYGKNDVYSFKLDNIYVDLNDYILYSNTNKNPRCIKTDNKIYFPLDEYARFKNIKFRLEIKGIDGLFNLSCLFTIKSNFNFVFNEINVTGSNKTIFDNDILEEIIL